MTPEPYGGVIDVVLNQSAGVMHAVSDGHALCFVSRTRQGRTVVATVDGYEGVTAYAAEAKAAEMPYEFCPECHDTAGQIAKDHRDALAQTAAEGAAAGRTIRYTLVIEEQIPEAATLFSIKDAEESFRYAIEDLRTRGAAVKVAVEFVESQA